jgi:gliding motility-associated peptidyl-prolyl isomerase
MKYSASLFLFLILVSCVDPIPRRPVSHSTKSFLKESVNRNKHINTLEENIIKYYIALDSLNSYKVSSNGFWFRYLKLKNEIKSTPELGEEVVFEYEISNLRNEVLYTFKELGEVHYKIDKENLESGLQSGLKLMKEGEEILFLFPSYKAFGILGDRTKIGMNQPLIYRVKLIKIK